MPMNGKHDTLKKSLNRKLLPFQSLRHKEVREASAANSRLSAPPHSRFCPRVLLAVFPLVGRFKESFEAFQHLSAVIFAFG
ncbi:MAG TPA: hypothetical protein VH575_09150, partial [Gemmataceae bacterium]